MPSGLTYYFPTSTYTVTAEFDDIGGLSTFTGKIGGVQIGEGLIGLDRSIQSIGYAENQR